MGVALHLIAAMANERVIGIHNTLPWHLPEDLQHFKRLTTGHSILMGRKTYESIGRPLPNRRNFVLTRQQDWHAEGVEPVGSLNQALADHQAQSDQPLWVLGGAELYQQALPLASQMYLTLIDVDCTGDAFFPEWQAADWQEITRESHTAANGLHYAFVQYQRKENKHA